MVFREYYEFTGQDMGYGEFFTVKEARRVGSGEAEGEEQRYAVKAICTLSWPEEDVRRLSVEMAFWKKLSHPCLLKLLEVFEEDSFTYMVYEYPTGGSLTGVLGAGPATETGFPGSGNVPPDLSVTTDLTGSRSSRNSFSPHDSEDADGDRSSAGGAGGRGSQSARRSHGGSRPGGSRSPPKTGGMGATRQEAAARAAAAVIANASAAAVSAGAGKLMEKEALEICKCLLQAVAFLHSKGVICGQLLTVSNVVFMQPSVTLVDSEDGSGTQKEQYHSQWATSCVLCFFSDARPLHSSRTIYAESSSQVEDIRTLGTLIAAALGVIPHGAKPDVIQRTVADALDRLEERRAVQPSRAAIAFLRSAVLRTDELMTEMQRELGANGAGEGETLRTSGSSGAAWTDDGLFASIVGSDSDGGSDSGVTRGVDAAASANLPSIAERLLRHTWIAGGSAGIAGSGTKHLFGVHTEDILKAHAQTQDDKDRKGWLWKRNPQRHSLHRPRWVRRWCVLREQVLFMWENERDAGEPSAAGCRPPAAAPRAISLKGVRACLPPDGYSAREHVFQLWDKRTRSAVMYLRGDNASSTSEWKGALNHHAGLHRYPLEDSNPGNSNGSNSNSTGTGATGRGNTGGESGGNGGMATDDEQDSDTDGYSEDSDGEAATTPMVRGRSPQRSNGPMLMVGTAASGRSGSPPASSGHKKGSSGRGRRRGRNKDSPPPTSMGGPVQIGRMVRKHPGVHWERRQRELQAIVATGKPVHAPVKAGERWYMVDCWWYRHWMAFVTSSDIMPPPGPINNYWMLTPDTCEPYQALLPDTDDEQGDYRRVTESMWNILHRLYGGGPIISVMGPPVDNKDRWEVEEILGSLTSPDGSGITDKSATAPKHVKRMSRAQLMQLERAAQSANFSDSDSENESEDDDAQADVNGKMSSAGEGAAVQSKQSGNTAGGKAEEEERTDKQHRQPGEAQQLNSQNDKRAETRAAGKAARESGTKQEKDEKTNDDGTLSDTGERTGWLNKRNPQQHSLHRPRWMRRWCELRDQVLFLWESEQELPSREPEQSALASELSPQTLPNIGSQRRPSAQRPKGPAPRAIALRGVSACDAPRDYSRRKFVFQLRDAESGVAVMYLRARTAEELEDWKQAINTQSQLHLLAPTTAAINDARDALREDSVTYNFQTPHLADSPDRPNGRRAGGEYGGSDADDSGTGGDGEGGVGVQRSRSMNRRPLPAGTVIGGRALAGRYTAVHPAVHWEKRQRELKAVVGTGKPVHADVEEGETWYIVDCWWYRHWLSFVTSKRRIPPPGPINNFWMLKPESPNNNVEPLPQLRFDSDTEQGHYRRVTEDIWRILLRLYGGGPAISVDGPPIEDVSRWKISKAIPSSTAPELNRRRAQATRRLSKLQVMEIRNAAEGARFTDSDDSSEEEDGDAHGGTAAKRRVSRRRLPTTREVSDEAEDDEDEEEEEEEEDAGAREAPPGKDGGQDDIASSYSTAAAHAARSVTGDD